MDKEALNTKREVIRQGQGVCDKGAEEKEEDIRWGRVI